jgi:diguanylate cyclase (GGDEF)-like protein/PAS domain S-box-containing protein
MLRVRRQTRGRCTLSSDVERDADGDPSRTGFTRELLNSDTEGVVLCDGNHTIVALNHRFQKMFGYSERDALGKCIDNLIVPPQLALEAAEITVAVSGGRPVSMETVRTRSDGSPLAVSVLASRCSTSWEMCSYYAIYRVLARQEWRRRRKGETTDSGFLTSLFHDADEPGLFTDSRNRVTAVNHSFCRQFGWKPEELVGESVTDMLVPHDLHDEESRVLNRIVTGTIIKTETALLDAYGARRRTGMLAVPVSLGDGAIGSYRAYNPTDLPAADFMAVKGRNRFQPPPFRHLPGLFFRVRNDICRTIDFISRPTATDGRNDLFPVENGLSTGVHPDDSGNLRSVLQESLETGGPYQVTYRVNTPSGERWVLEQGCPDDDRLGFEGYIVDITASKRVEEMVAKARKRLEDLHGIASLLQRSATESEIHRICAESACTLLDADCGMILTCHDGSVQISHRARTSNFNCPENCYRDLAVMVMETGKQMSFNSRDTHITNCSFARNGVCRPLTENSVFLALSHRDDAFTESLVGVTDLLLGYAEQSLRRIALQRRLIDQAIHDPLTGTYNRNHFNRLVELEENRARRDGTTLGFIMVDIDNFKAINDTRGHQTGDTVLREVAAVLQRAVRKADTVIRYGGDEFLIILSRVDSMTEMVEARIRKMLGKEVFPGFKVTVSMGHSQWEPDLGSSIDEAISRADRMMYEEKRSRTTT